MHDDKPDQFVDELLEASLKQYRGEEPRSGLEMRILAGIRARERAARRRWLGWVVAVCTGMFAMVFFALHFAREPLRQLTPSSRLPQPAATQPAPAMVSQLHPGLRLRGSGGPVHEPKEKPRTPKPGVRATERPEQFPTPYPLTEQEKLLLAYLSNATNRDLVAATSETDEALITDLEISAIKIAPLEIEPLDDSQAEQEK